MDFSNTDFYLLAYQQIDPTTWAAAASVLMLSIFFKFNRFWSVRNFDLLLIIAMAPFLLMVNHGMNLANQHVIDAPTQANAQTVDSSEESTLSQLPPELDGTDEFSDADVVSPPGRAMQRNGFIGLFGVGALYLIRMLVDPVLVRRPLLNPNLSLGGLVFLGVCLIALLLANIFSAKPTTDELNMVKSTIRMAKRQAADETESLALRKRGPGYQMLFFVAVISVFSDNDQVDDIVIEQQTNFERYILVLKILAIVSQSLIVLGLILFSVYNFNSFYIGVGIASVYLLLPYTAIYTGHVEHALPAALMLWALVCFRKPALSGLLLGLATGASYYPLFLLPLWLSFYWERGVRRFAICVGISIFFCAVGPMFTSISVTDYFLQLQKMFGFWQPLMEGLDGIWALGWDRVWRLPLLIAFVILCASFTIWPARKDIGVLIAYSGAVMIGVQFWHGFGGGLFAAWYLPMMLLVFFRTNLSGRTAMTELPALRTSNQL
jgi:hypothetical protein